MTKLKFSSQSDQQLLGDINRLHAEISTLTQNNIQKAIRAGELLTEIKVRIGHGDWRVWVASNLGFSIRTASRYMRFWNHKDELTDVKNVRQAQAVLGGKREKGLDAIGADYKKIWKELVRPIRLAHRNLGKLSYEGDSPETLDQILQEMLAETQGIITDLQEILE